jgi:spore maturation protein SpmB
LGRRKGTWDGESLRQAKGQHMQGNGRLLEAGRGVAALVARREGVDFFILPFLKKIMNLTETYFQVLSLFSHTSLIDTTH